MEVERRPNHHDTVQQLINQAVEETKYVQQLSLSSWTQDDDRILAGICRNHIDFDYNEEWVEILLSHHSLALVKQKHAEMVSRALKIVKALKIKRTNAQRCASLEHETMISQLVNTSTMKRKCPGANEIDGRLLKHHKLENVLESDEDVPPSLNQTRVVLKESGNKLCTEPKNFEDASESEEEPKSLEDHNTLMDHKALEHGMTLENDTTLEYEEALEEDNTLEDDEAIKEDNALEENKALGENKALEEDKALEEEKSLGDEKSLEDVKVLEEEKSLVNDKPLESAPSISSSPDVEEELEMKQPMLNQQSDEKPSR